MFKAEDFTVEHAEALFQVCHGADITSYGNALRCRDLESLGFLEITDAMNPPDEFDKKPYFGCIATDDGRQFLEDWVWDGGIMLRIQEGGGIER